MGGLSALLRQGIRTGKKILKKIPEDEIIYRKMLKNYEKIYTSTGKASPFKDIKKGNKIYHATDQDVKRPQDLDPYKKRNIYNIEGEEGLSSERGVSYFTSDPKFTEQFIEKDRGIGFKDKSRILFGELKTNKIFNLNKNKDYEKLKNALIKKYGIEKANKLLQRKKDIDLQTLKDLESEYGVAGILKEDYYLLENPEVRDVIKELGYDGFQTIEDIYRGKKAVGLFNPELSVKKHGGRIMNDPNKNYNAQRFI